MIGSDPLFSVSEFVAVFNQTLELAFPRVGIVGEISNFRISKNRWVYFDLKDIDSSVKFFGATTSLPGPLEDGISIEAWGYPRLHPQFGFSINFSILKPVGEGSIARASKLLEQKLTKEGLFDQSRKRQLPYPPSRIGLVTSIESAAYSDFIKIINNRWGNIDIKIVDCLVQGVDAPAQIVSAIDKLNQLPEPMEAIVIIRGGGSQDDLAAFNNELLVRSIAASRIPVLAAIGHERDVSLAELAADQRASTPSHAAEILVPDKIGEEKVLKDILERLGRTTETNLIGAIDQLGGSQKTLGHIMDNVFIRSLGELENRTLMLRAFDPYLPLKRGYAIARDARGKLISSLGQVKPKDKIGINLSDGKIIAEVIGEAKNER